ncbi:hypothetical protein QFZ77_004731 [Paenibacillus sp. V4I3]|nr:hypothetical protein [Paenibacillus sp. V4I3]MDQ0887979.1 hypothetical protein [Paenibacillus sp. V4I9]
MLWIALGGLGLLISFVISWKREGITQAILNLISLLSFLFAFIDPFNNIIRVTIYLPALICALASITISIILWRRSSTRR